MAKDKKGGRSRDTVTREYTINLHKKLHNTNCELYVALRLFVLTRQLRFPPSAPGAVKIVA